MSVAGQVIGRKPRRAAALASMSTDDAWRAARFVLDPGRSGGCDQCRERPFEGRHCVMLGRAQSRRAVDCLRHMPAMTAGNGCSDARPATPAPMPFHALRGRRCMQRDWRSGERGGENGRTSQHERERRQNQYQERGRHQDGGRSVGIRFPGKPREVGDPDHRDDPREPDAEQSHGPFAPGHRFVAHARFPEETWLAPIRPHTRARST